MWDTEEGVFSTPVGLFLALLLQSLRKLRVPVSAWERDDFPRGMSAQQAARKLVRRCCFQRVRVCLPACARPPRPAPPLPLPALPFS